MTGGGEDSSPSAPAQDPATGGSGGAERGEGGEEEGPSPPSAPAGSSYPQRHVAALINLGAVLANTAAAPSSTSEDDDVAFRRRCEEALGLQIEASRALTEGLLLSSSRVSGGGGGGGAAAAAANPITVNPSSANPNEAKSAAAPPLLIIEMQEATESRRRAREEREERVLRRLKSAWEYHKGQAEASLRSLRDNDRKMMNGHPLAGVLKAALLVVNGTPPPPPAAMPVARIFFVPEEQLGEDEGEDVQQEKEGQAVGIKAMTIKCKYNTYLENDFGVPYFCYTSSVASRDGNEAGTFQHNNKRARRDPHSSGNPSSRMTGGCAALRRFLPIFPQSMYQERELFASLPYPVTVLIREGFALDCNEGDKMKEGGSDRERDNFSQYCCYSSGANEEDKSRNESPQQPPSSLGHGNIFDCLPTSHSFPVASAAAAPSSGPPAPPPPRCHPSGPPAHFMLDAFQEEIARARRQQSSQQQASKNPSRSDIKKKTPSLEEEERKRKNRQQRKAAAARDTVVLLYNAALCHHRLGDDGSALRLFSRARIVLNESYNAMEEAMEKEAEEEEAKEDGGGGGNDAEGHYCAPTWEPTLQDVALRLLAAQASQNEGQIHDRYGQRKAAALTFLTAYGDAADAFEMAAMCLNGSEVSTERSGKESASSGYATLLAQCVRCAALARSNLGRSEYLRGRLGEALAELRDGADVLTRFAHMFPLDLSCGDEEGEGSGGRVAVLPALVLPPGTKAVMERDASLLAHNAAIVQRMMATRRVGGMEGSRQSGQR